MAGTPPVLPSVYDYKIYKSGSTINRADWSTGTVQASGTSYSSILNGALQACNAKGGGSIYTVADSYLTTGPIGATGFYNTEYSNIMVVLQNGTVITCGSGSGPLNHLFDLENQGAETSKFTLMSDGIATLDGAGRANLMHITQISNSAFCNLRLQHGWGSAPAKGGGIEQIRCRNNYWDNIFIYSFAEGEDGGGFFNSNVIDSTFRNIWVEGIYGVNRNRLGIYLGDWDSLGIFDGCYRNTWTNVTVKNIWHDGIYLNAGATGNGVHHNTFDQVLLDTNWGAGYDAIKLRPANHNKFTNVVIRNYTDPITTGTSYDGSETHGNCEYNEITAEIYDSTVSSLILTCDGSNQSVNNNQFVLKFHNCKPTWFANGTNSSIRDNTIYLTFIGCAGGIRFDAYGGPFTNNKFYCAFQNSGASLPDIRIDSLAGITNNTFYVSEHGTNTFLQGFTSGQNGNVVQYPYPWTPPIANPTLTVHSTPEGVPFFVRRVV